MIKPKPYLGDGAYYAFDGNGVELTTSDGISTTNRIYLEPEVLADLLRALVEDFELESIARIIGAKS